jgi:uncharacterized protein (DUF427 family)
MRRHPRSVRPVPPGPGQESVWDYPRPPALERSARVVQVRFGGALIAESSSAWRVMETSHPPSWYIPRADIDGQYLRRSTARSTLCEWKGAATYWDVTDGAGGVLEAVGWSYETPTPRFAAIAGHLSFMPGSGERASIDRAPAIQERGAQRTSRMNDGLECSIDGELVLPQACGFYGGWITADVVGPFKGEPGSWGW